MRRGDIDHYTCTFNVLLLLPHDYEEGIQVYLGVDYEEEVMHNRCMYVEVWTLRKVLCGIAALRT